MQVQAGDVVAYFCGFWTTVRSSVRVCERLVSCVICGQSPHQAFNIRLWWTNLWYVGAWRSSVSLLTCIQTFGADEGTSPCVVICYQQVSADPPLDQLIKTTTTISLVGDVQHWSSVLCTRKVSDLTRCQSLGKLCDHLARANNSLWRQRVWPWLHRCSWPPLLRAYATYRLFAHAFRLQTDIRTELHFVSFAFTGGERKKMFVFCPGVAITDVT